MWWIVWRSILGSLLMIAGVVLALWKEPVGIIVFLAGAWTIHEARERPA
jgi:hypothetical protein